MFETASLTDPRLAFAIYVAMVVVAVVGILVVARILRASATPPRGSSIYESSAPAHVATTVPVPAAYFQIAAFFVIFDFEAAILYTGAVAETGVAGLVSATIFIFVLLAALFYLWADGAFDTGTETREKRL